LISRLFALLTARLEDSAARAVEGQGRQVINLYGLAQALETELRDVHTIAEAGHAAG
jgi:hypothetical protein